VTTPALDPDVIKAAGRSGAFDQAPALLETTRREFERVRLEIASELV
jgi:hypothetical protein